MVLEKGVRKMVSWFSRLLTIGNVGDDVRLVQRKLNCHASGKYDNETAARVRGVQKAHGLLVTGMVDTTTAEKIGEHSRWGLVPDWFSRELEPGSHGEDVSRLTDMLGVEMVPDYTPEVEAAVRRFQSAHRLPLTGRITEVDALSIGDVLHLSA